MNAHIKPFKLTRRVKLSLEGRNYDLSCSRCGEALQEDDDVVTKRRFGKGTHRYYHRACWEALFF